MIEKKNICEQKTHHFVMNSINITPKFISIMCTSIAQCELKKFNTKKKTNSTHTNGIERKKNGNNKQEVIETNCVRPIAFVICDQLDLLFICIVFRSNSTFMHGKRVSSDYIVWGGTYNVSIPSIFLQNQFHWSKNSRTHIHTLQTTRTKCDKENKRQMTTNTFQRSRPAKSHSIR